MMTFRSSFGHHGKALSRASRTTFVERAPRVPGKQAQKAKELFVKKTRIVAAVASAAIFSIALVGCSAGTSGSSGGKQTLSIEDYYTKTYDPIYNMCAKQVGVNVTPSHVAGAGLIAKVLQQASSKTMPDVLMLDNPDVQQIASTGALSPLSDYGITAAGDVPGVG